MTFPAQDPAELYDALFPLEQGYLDFVDEEVSGARDILEFGSGTGRLAVPLAMRGHAITGVDINPNYVSAAERKAKAAGVEERCDFIVEDFAKFRTSATFDTAFLSSNTLSLVADPQARFDTFQRLGACLTPSARLMVIMVNTARLLRDGPHRETQRRAALSDGTQVRQVEVRRYNPLESQWRGANTLEMRLPDGQRTRRVWEVRHGAVLTPEIIYLADCAGFGLERLYGDFSRNPLSLDSPRAIYILNKRA